MPTNHRRLADRYLQLSGFDRERGNDPMIQLRARVVDEAVGVTCEVEQEHRPFVVGPVDGVAPGRPPLDGRLDQGADRIGAETLREILPVAQIVVLRCELAEPGDLDVKLTALGR
jgi:hypothetical protein